MAKSIPPFLSQARTFYAAAFAHHRKSELAAAMVEWGELDESEQSFALAHLTYLNIEAHAQTQQLLVHLRELIDEIAEVFTVALETSLAEGPPEEPHDAPGEEPPEPSQTHADVIDAAPAEAS